MIGMKVYDLQWFTVYGMNFDRAAEALCQDGVDTVLTQNFIDPLPSSGVDQSVYRARFGSRLETYSDLAWHRALKAAGLRVIQTTATFFDPAALIQFPDARPINALGEPDHGFDWYTGVCPTSEEYLVWKIDRMRRVVEELQPDGYFLQFTRFPGFWENWTWNPHYVFSLEDQWCFCDRCRGLFSSATGIGLPGVSVGSDASIILAEHRETWVRWRSGVLKSIIDNLAEASGARTHGLQIMLNTLPFPRSDFGGLDVRRTICGQDLALLSDSIDCFELMTYLQILKRPVSWIDAVVTDAILQVPTGTKLVCTLQVNPLYTSGVHAGRARTRESSADQLWESASTAFHAGADGLVFYHWTDFLEDEASGGTKRQMLREITSRMERPA
ncbi:MAG: hypothetical protein AB7V46_02010 [Thermomicrobiales bacterium]